MSTVSGKQRSVGLRKVQAYVLDSNGWPAGATGQNLYTGVDFEGGRAFTINTPNPRAISHDDNDIVQQIDYLPSLEGATGELRVGIDNQIVNAALTGVTEYELGEAKLVDWQTSRQGNEPDVALLMYQQSLDTSLSTRRWRLFIADAAKAIPKASNFTGEKSETVYNIALSPAENHVWGTARADGTEGNTKAAFSTGMAEGKPQLGFALGNGTETEFTFAADEQATAVGKIECWVDGVLQSTGITVAVTGVTFAAAPAADAKIAIKWEY